MSNSYNDGQCRKELAALEKVFSPADEYGGHLFSLYCKYLKRFQIRYRHFSQAQALKDFLEKTKIQPILSWQKVYDLDSQYPSLRSYKTSHLHPFLKIGYMLQELGVLEPKSQELGRQIQTLLNIFDAKTMRHLEPFLLHLKESNRAQATILKHLSTLRGLYLWLKEHYPEASLLEVNSAIFDCYLQAVMDKNVKYRHVKNTYLVLNYFFRFCEAKSLILANPCNPPPSSRAQRKLRVTSETDYKKLIAFIRNPKANPEWALILTLSLFYGFTLQDLANAQVAFEKSICITLRRQKLTRGRSHYYRDQNLKLPTTPTWFLALQKRFANHWQEQRSQIKSVYPGSPLFLPITHQHNRPLSPATIALKIIAATTLATGKRIPAGVLRQTCGHVHAINHNTPFLNRIGWSSQGAYLYTWLPREYFNSSQT